MLDTNLVKRSCSLSGLHTSTRYRSSSIPRRFLCLLTNKLMKDPVTTPSGSNFERSELMCWLEENGQQCPKTGHPLEENEIRSNALLQWEILYWQRRNTGESGPGEPRVLDSNTSPRCHSSLDNLLRIHQDQKHDVPPTMPSHRNDTFFTIMSEGGCDSPPAFPKRKGSCSDLESLGSLDSPCCTTLDSPRSQLANSSKHTNALAQRLILEEMVVAIAKDSPTRIGRQCPPQQDKKPFDLCAILGQVEQMISEDR